MPLVNENLGHNYFSEEDTLRFQMGFLNTFGDGLHEIFSYEESEVISLCWDCRFSLNLHVTAPCFDCNGSGKKNMRNYFQDML